MGGGKKLILKYIIPYTFFQFIVGGFIFAFKVLVLHESYMDLLTSAAKQIVLYSGSYSLYMDHLWFLITLPFALAVVKFLVDLRNKGKHSGVLFDILAIVGLSFMAISMTIIPLHIPLRIQTIPAAALFAYVGKRFHNEIDNASKQIGFTGWFVSIVLFTVSAICNKTVNVSLYTYNDFFLFLFTSMVGIIVTLRVSTTIHSRALNFIGRNSLIMYGIHGVWIQLFGYFLTRILGNQMRPQVNIPIPYCLIGGLLVITLSALSFIALNRVYNKYRILKEKILKF